MEAVAFKIWYSDSVFESITGLYSDWLGSPDMDIQEVMFYFKEDSQGRLTRSYALGNDFYALTPEFKFTSHFDDITKVAGHIKYGKWTTWENHCRIAAEAFADYGEGWLFEKPPEPVIVPEKGD